jgi:hypothetical protein
MAPALRELIDALGGPAVEDPDSDLLRLIEWSTQMLDTRDGAERQAAARITFPDSQMAALLNAAGPLGLLITGLPRLPSYDITVVLGGTITGNELRTRLAADLASSGIGVGQVVGLTAERFLTDAERDASGLRTESEHLDVALSDAFGHAGLAAQSGAGRGGDRTPEIIGLKRANILMLTAPSSRPGRRADTEDAIRYLADQFAPPARRRLLVVTSAVYVSYQFFVVAPLMLAEGSQHVEVVGTPTATAGSPKVLAQRVAQEIHATFVTLARVLGLR